MSFKDLIPWYQRHQRQLPFRQTTSPYDIWVAEIMLQQTQVATMLPYYERFLKRFDSIQTLAKATFEEILPYVTGMGYYRRFKLMHQASKVIMTLHEGIFPNTYEAVRALPGIGDYTAGAIMSTAFKKPYSALDGNVMRVLTRVYSIDDDIRKPSTVKKLNTLNQSLMIKDAPDLYTHAMMELGATICKPTQPKCEACPLQDICQSYANQTQLAYPFKSQLVPKKHIKYMTCIIYDSQYQYVLKKETQSLFEGMYLFLQVESESVHYTMEWLLEQGIEVDYDQYLTTVKHVFTHQIWDMEVHLFKLKSMRQTSFFLATKDDPKFNMMPIAHSKINKFLKQ